MRKVIILLFLFFTGLQLTAQEYDYRRNYENRYIQNRNSIRLSYGILPLDLMFFNSLVSYKDLREPQEINKPNIHHPYSDNSINGIYSGRTILTGMTVLEYNYKFHRVISVSASLTYSTAMTNKYSYKGDFLYTSRDEQILFMPILRFTWLRREQVRLYSSVGLGLGNYIEHGGDKWASFALHLNPIGVEIGGRLYGIFEVNVGMTGFLRAGIGYSF